MLVNRRIAATLVAVIVLLAVSISLAVAVEVAPGVQIKGYMQNRVYLAPGNEFEFRSERISLSAVAALPEDSTAYVEVYYHPWAPTSGLYLESAYYDTKLGPGRVRIGKGRRMTFGMTPSWPNRKTSNYGLVAESFTQDRIQGVQYMVQQGVLDAGISVHTGHRIGSRNMGEVPGDSQRNSPVTHQVAHIAFRDLASGTTPLSVKPAVSARLGGNWPIGLKAGLSAQIGNLDPADFATLTAAGFTPSSSNTMNVIGLDATYKQPSGFILQGEYYKADVSNIDYNAWNVLAGMEMKNGWKYFARYAKKDMDVLPLAAFQQTWDAKQISLSMVQPLRKGLWLQYEAEINTETPPAGTSSVENNLFFVELFAGF